MLSTLYFCTQLIIPCPNATGRWLLYQEMHRNICYHMEETVYTGPASLCEEGLPAYSITVYKITPLEDKQGKKKKKKRGKKTQKTTSNIWGKNARRDNKALWTHCIALFSKQKLCFIVRSITLIHPTMEI